MEWSGAQGTGSGKIAAVLNGVAKTLDQDVKSIVMDDVRRGYFSGYVIGNTSVPLVNGNWAFKNYILEVLIFNQVLAPGEAANVRAFLATENGITL
jgi:hypothetical protein